MIGIRTNLGAGRGRRRKGHSEDSRQDDEPAFEGETKEAGREATDGRGKRTAQEAIPQEDAHVTMEDERRESDETTEDGDASESESGIDADGKGAVDGASKFESGIDVDGKGAVATEENRATTAQGKKRRGRTENPHRRT